MLSLGIKCALEREIVGQPRAVGTLVRALTIAMSGLGSPESPLGVYLLVGPSGTGKSHTARSVTRVLHGDLQRLVVVDCVHLGGRDGWTAMARQIAPYFPCPPQGQGGMASMAPHSVLLVEHLEAATAQFVQALVAALESGRLLLPDGNHGSLRGCLVLMTSNLCAREIYGEDRQLGFSPATDMEESEKARIFQVCASSVEKRWGSDLLGHVDDLVVYHRLREGHFPFILNRLVADLNSELAPRRISCRIEPAAARFLLERSIRFIHSGAWLLSKVFRRFVRFPVADMLSGADLVPGSCIRVEYEDGERLRYTIAPSEGCGVDSPRAGATAVLRIPVRWDEAPAMSEPVGDPGLSPEFG